MEDEDMITDMTLDLPDLSDASLSFQIPAHIASVDLLLADNTDDDFDRFYNAPPGETSFGFTQSRRRPLTLGELTPMSKAMSRSPTPTPSIIPRLRTCSPIKAPSRAISIPRQLGRPLVSEERLDHLRTRVATFGQDDDAPLHVLKAELDVEPVCPAIDCLPVSQVTLPVRQDTHQDIETSAQGDTVVPARDNAPSDATNITFAAAPSKSSRNPRMTANPSIPAGGTSNHPVLPTSHVFRKKKSKPSRVKDGSNLLPSTSLLPTPPQSIVTDTIQELVPPAAMSGDTDVNSENIQIILAGTGGMAERLVSYSEKIISSIGLYKPWSESSSAEASTGAVRVADTCVESCTPATPLPPLPQPHHINGTPSAPNEPLRLSEISPHKPPANAPQSNSPANTGTAQDARRHAVSPMRPPKKRVSVDADLAQQNQPRKKGRVWLAAANSERRSSDKAVSQAHSNKDPHEEQVTPSATRDSTCHLESTLPNARTKYKPRFNFSSRCKGPTLDAFPYLSTLRQVQGTCDKVPSGSLASSHQRRDKRARQRSAAGSCHARHHSGPTSTGDLPLIEKKQNATLSLTKPVGFTFRVDARLEARKREERLAESEPAKTHAVPEYKALRASHQAAKQRAKERDKFDAMVRRKDEETQRVMEAQRRREAEEDALAIKELRRKAIPKANDVPEWYAEMPKRKGAAV